ncbi:MAG: hypothetical protein SFY92_05430 [Verrucomicrobiae bacterium]|nr:hypothetical protein [Verrucomicrobiae bacterium]
MHTPKSLLLSAVVLSLAVTVLPSRAGDRVSAYEALRGAQKNVRDAIRDNLMEMRAEKGTPNPEKWEVVFFDPKEGSKKVVVDMKGADFLDDRRPADLFEDYSQKWVIDLKKLRLDSDKAYKMVEEIAQKENKLTVSKADFRLKKIKDADPDSNPIWIIRAYDSQNHYLGEVTISAFSGKVLRTRKLWYQGQRDKDFFEEVEGFFTGDDSKKDKKKGDQ